VREDEKLWQREELYRELNGGVLSTFGGGVMSTLVGMEIPGQLFQLKNGCDITQ
jgi:hypothetical protein